jgi:hypothetical protein
MDATDAMSAADATILQALATGGLEDAPAEVSLALLRCGVSMVQALDAILAHYAPQIGEPHDTEHRYTQARLA